MIVQYVRTFVETIYLLLKREQRVITLMVLGFLLLANAAQVASWLGVAEVAPVLFKAGLVAFAMSFARILLRVFFPWMDLFDLVKKAQNTSIGSAAVAVATIYLVVEMFRLLSVT